MPVSPEEPTPAPDRRRRFPWRRRRGAAPQPQHAPESVPPGGDATGAPVEASGPAETREPAGTTVPAYAPEAVSADAVMAMELEAFTAELRRPLGKAHIVRTVDRQADERGGYAVTLYRLEPPTWVWAQHVTHVLVVGTWASTGLSTTIHMATEDGRMALTCEMPGSFQGAVDHVEALRRLGYLVTL